MSIRFTAKARRGVVALTLATGLAIGVAGCGGSDDDSTKPEATASASNNEGSDPQPQEGESDEVQAELRGTSGLILQITTAERDSGGFVTVFGTLKNDSDKTITIPASLQGDETEVMAHGRSLGGATLVDSKEKKRYYVLRDTDGRPLTTTGMSILKAGETLPVFMQFPSPPTSTTEVSLQLPTFSSATIKISG